MAAIRWTVWRYEDAGGARSLEASAAIVADARTARAEMLRQVERLIAIESEGDKARVRAALSAVSLTTIVSGARWKEWIVRVRPLRYVRVVVEDLDQNQGSILGGAGV